MLLPLILSLPLALSAQTGQGVLTQINLARNGEQIEFEAVCRNFEEFRFLLNVRIGLVRKDQTSASVDSTLEGTITIQPESELVFFTYSIPRDSLPYFGMIVEIYQNGALVSRDAFPKNLRLVQNPTRDQSQNPANPDLVQPDETRDPSLAGGPLELNGYIIEATLTRAGQEFAQLFSNKWQNQSLPGDYTIKIEELPFRGRSTQLVMYLDDEEIFRRFIQPGYDFLDELSTALVNYFAQLVRQQKQTQRDLQGDLRGSGIY